MPCGTSLADFRAMVWCFFDNGADEGEARFALSALKSELFRPTGTTIPT